MWYKNKVIFKLYLANIDMLNKKGFRLKGNE